MRRVLLAAAGWLGAALVAAVVGLLALTLLRDGVGGGGTQALSQQAAAQALARAEQSRSAGQRATSATPHASSAAPQPSSSAQPSSSTPPAPSSTPPRPATSGPSPGTGPRTTSGPGTTSGPRATPGVTRALHSLGGTVLARCEGGAAQLMSWTVRQGFEADDVERRPGGRASMQFESEDVDVRVTVRCENGTPVQHAAVDRED